MKNKNNELDFDIISEEDLRKFIRESIKTKNFKEASGAGAIAGYTGYFPGGVKPQVQLSEPRLIDDENFSKLMGVPEDFEEKIIDDDELPVQISNLDKKSEDILASKKTRNLSGPIKKVYKKEIIENFDKDLLDIYIKSLK